MVDAHEIAVDIGVIPETEKEGQRIAAEAIIDVYTSVHPWLFSPEASAVTTEITSGREAAQQSIATSIAHAAVIHR